MTIVLLAVFVTNALCAVSSDQNEPPGGKPNSSEPVNLEMSERFKVVAPAYYRMLGLDDVPKGLLNHIEVGFTLSRSEMWSHKLEKLALIILKSVERRLNSSKAKRSTVLHAPFHMLMRFLRLRSRMIGDSARNVFKRLSLVTFVDFTNTIEFFSKKRPTVGFYLHFMGISDYMAEIKPDRNRFDSAVEFVEHYTIPLYVSDKFIGRFRRWYDTKAESFYNPELLALENFVIKKIPTDPEQRKTAILTVKEYVELVDRIWKEAKTLLERTARPPILKKVREIKALLDTIPNSMEEDDS